jgi:predicted GH43/DUF377 family glycosyl hydrolase
MTDTSQRTATPLEATVEGLGEGNVFQLEGGGTLFKLDSFSGNPIIEPQELGLTWLGDNSEPLSGAVFNGGAALLDGRVVLTPRCHQKYVRRACFDGALETERFSFENYVSEVWPLVSEDGVHFERMGNLCISGDGTQHVQFSHGIEDVRIIQTGSGYLLVGTGKIVAAHSGVKDGDRIAVYWTDDFTNIHYRGMVDAFDTRNAVPFPEPIGGRSYMLLRFHPDIHLNVLTGGLDQLLDPENHAEAWAAVYEDRTESLLLKAGLYLHEREKIGPGTPLIWTDRGWLLVYHSVGEIRAEVCRPYGIEGPITRGYSICAALLALDDPRRVLYRTREPIYLPSAPYELYGDEEYPVDVPAVVFPVGALVRSGKLLIYAGAGDKYVALLSCQLEKLVDYLCEHCAYPA